MRLQPALHVRPKSVLFATDFSRASENALRHAIAVARHYDATLHLVHIVSSVGFMLAGPGLMACADDAARRDLQQLEYNLLESGVLQGVKHDLFVRDGEIWPEIRTLIADEEVDLVVIGTHGRRGIGRLLLGSVAEEIFRCAECPVITVGPAFRQERGVENTRQPRPVLFATDFQEASLQALPYVLDFAKERHVKVVLLHVIPLLPLPNETHWESADNVLIRRQKAEAEARERLRNLLNRHAWPAIEPEFIVKFGDASEEILKAAAGLRADVIAMGLHRTVHPQAVTHLRSSVAYDVVCRANCAVLTTRD